MKKLSHIILLQHYLATVNKPEHIRYFAFMESRVLNFVYTKCILIGCLVVWDDTDVSQIYGYNGTLV